MKFTSKQIALIAINFALITVLTFIGLKPIFGIINIAVLSLIGILVAVQVFGFGVGVITTTYFGLLSLINSFISPSGILYPYLQNPLISVFPRALIGVTAYFSYKFFSRLFSGSEAPFVRNILPSALSAAVGVITNTVFVLGLMSLLYGTDVVSTSTGAMPLNTFLAGIIATNTLIELAGCILFVPPIVYALGKAKIGLNKV